MHEFSIVKKEVDKVNQKANGKKVSKAVFFLGRLAHGSVDSIAEAFRMASANTPLSQARLEIVHIEPRIKCSGCGVELSFASDMGFACLQCGCASHELITGKECHIESIEVED